MSMKSFLIINTISLLVMFYVTYLSLALPLGGNTTKDLSDLYLSFFTPSGFTFMIWNLIYLGLIGFVLKGFFISKGALDENDFVSNIGWLFSSSCLLNAAWLFAWHYNQIWLSIIIMLCLLYVLIRIYQILEVGINQSGPQSSFLVRGPFQLYLGWISVATIANFAAFLIYIGLILTIGVQQIIAFGLMLVVLFIAFKLRKERNDWIFPSVIAWALIGIGVKYVNDERAGVWIALPAFIIAGIIILLTILLSLRRFQTDSKVTQ